MSQMPTSGSNAGQGALHPGSSRRQSGLHPKGRQVEKHAVDEIRALLGEGPRRRDLLIEYLHLIQDQYACLSFRHLAALADEMRLSMSEVYEVATFYAHFDVVEKQEAAPRLTVRVCDSLSCELLGASEIFDGVRSTLAEDIRVVRAPCMGRCDLAPVVEVGHRHVDKATIDDVAEAVCSGQVHPEMPHYRKIGDYVATGGYEILLACLAGERDVETIIATLEGSVLRGLGGAGFPTGKKWRIVRGYPGPRLMAVNADEGEPGTFKDRHYLETDPHRFLEGVLIAAWAVEAKDVYIYVRDEYSAVRQLLMNETAVLKTTGLSLHTRLDLRRGAGAYICGEESAMLESIEGKRGLPRHRPPYVAQCGLFQRPTLVQNVETLYWVPEILRRSADWFASHGRHGGKGLRSYSVSGRVNAPGVKLAPAGITVRELIDEYCGGMLDGHKFKAYLPGGASGGILPARLGDLPLDFGALEKFGCFVGSHAVVIMSDKDNVKDAALNLMRFFEDESCGQCTPCRVGTEKAVTLMQRPSWDTGLLEELGQVMAGASICGLGQAASNPLRCVLKYFPEELL